MRLAVASSLAALLLSGISVAQTSAPAQGAVFNSAPGSSGCPVEFSAQRDGTTIAQERHTGNNSQPPELQQSLKVTLDRNNAPRIARLTITVYGRKLSALFMPLTGSNTDTNSVPNQNDLSESFNFAHPAPGLDLTTYSVRSTIPLVTRVEITAIDFSDGTTWRKSPTDTCTVAPSLYVPVNAGAK